MADSPAVAVTSRSFSKHPLLREETLALYPEARFNDEGLSLSGDALVAYLEGAQRAITALERIDGDVLARLPDLEVISKVGAGIDMIDLDAMERHGVRLAWHPGTNSRSVAELVVALALAVMRKIAPLAQRARAGSWRQEKGWLLSDRTVGIVGYGAVGREVARLVEAFGCPVLAFDVRPLDDLPPHVEQVDRIDDLLRRSDVVSIHVGLSAATRNLIDASRLALMQPTAILINTARGGVVDDDALAEALREGSIAGAGLDVLAQEPPRDHELLTLDNALVTPHIGGSTEEAILAMGRAAIAGLDTAESIPSVRSRLQQ